MVYGKIQSGYLFGFHWSISPSKDGNIIFFWSKDGSILFKDNGKRWIEGDSLCFQYDKQYDGIKSCGEIFYNPQGNDQNKSKYLYAFDYGIGAFSVDDALPNE